MRPVDPAEIINIIKHLKIYGYAHIKKICEDKEIDEYRRLILTHYEIAKKNTVKGVPARDSSDKTLYNLQNKDKKFIDFISHPALTDILKPMLNDPYYRFLPAENPNYILSYYNARSSGNTLDLHIDSYIPAPGDLTWVMQVTLVVDQFRFSNGATVVVPGSHLSGKYTDRSLSVDEMKVITAEPGDLVLWDSRLWHGTTANIENTDRWALIATFTSWWIKQAMDIPRGLPESIYKVLSDEQKRLLGYCSIPPKNELERINTKNDYSFLKATIADYYESH